MSSDYCVYYGPYIEVKTTGLKHQVTYDYQGCVNASCSHHEKASTGNFCSRCGNKCEMISEIVDEAWESCDMVQDMGIDDQVSVENRRDENGDTEIFCPIHESSRTNLLSLKYDEVWEDLSSLDIKKEIEKVRTHCAKALDILEKVYNVKPIIKWGILGFIS